MPRSKLRVTAISLIPAVPVVVLFVFNFEDRVAYRSHDYKKKSETVSELSFGLIVGNRDLQTEVQRERL